MISNTHLSAEDYYRIQHKIHSGNRIEVWHPDRGLNRVISADYHSATQGIILLFSNLDSLVVPKEDFLHLFYLDEPVCPYTTRYATIFREHGQRMKVRVEIDIPLTYTTTEFEIYLSLTYNPITGIVDKAVRSSWLGESGKTTTDVLLFLQGLGYGQTLAEEFEKGMGIPERAILEAAREYQQNESDIAQREASRRAEIQATLSEFKITLDKIVRKYGTRNQLTPPQKTLLRLMMEDHILYGSPNPAIRDGSNPRTTKALKRMGLLSETEQGLILSPEFVQENNLISLLRHR